MHKIIILNHNTGEVHIFDYDTNIYDNYEDFYSDMEEEGYHFIDSQCSCMIVEKLNLTIH